MMKISRRETVVLLLGGVACLGGCTTSSGFKKPTLPEKCYWLELQYAWFCIPVDIEPRTEPPAPGKSTELAKLSEMWEILPYSGH